MLTAGLACHVWAAIPGVAAPVHDAGTTTDQETSLALDTLDVAVTPGQLPAFTGELSPATDTILPLPVDALVSLDVTEAGTVQPVFAFVLSAQYDTTSDGDATVTGGDAWLADVPVSFADAATVTPLAPR